MTQTPHKKLLRTNHPGQACVYVRRMSGSYYMDTQDQWRGGITGERIGITSQQAAERAIAAMRRLTRFNPHGGVLDAPESVMRLVPPELREVKPRRGPLAGGRHIQQADTL